MSERSCSFCCAQLTTSNSAFLHGRGQTLERLVAKWTRLDPLRPYHFDIDLGDRAAWGCVRP